MNTVAKHNRSRSEPDSRTTTAPRKAGNSDKDITAIVDNLFRALPLIHRKLLKLDLEGTGISRLHLPILGILWESGALPVSEVGRRLFISKPQMTSLVDRLTKLGFVVRQPDGNDRRVINIAITDQGRKSLTNLKTAIRDSLGKRLSVLGKEELKELGASLDRLVQIASKIE
ncbi:MAG: MarR family winged helix-turn-helix transcriptional regulator [Dehalococcoidia bacterium]|nr:MarR family winged helix-turn-helix transcriptional regulator [Dehalococcoidia bacterium]